MGYRSPDIWSLMSTSMLFSAASPSLHEPANLVRLLQGQLLEASAEAAQRLVVVLAQMVRTELMAELVDQQLVHVFGRSPLEPGVAEPQEVEVESPGPVGGGEVVGCGDHRDGDGHAHQFPCEEPGVVSDVPDALGPLLLRDDRDG